MRRDKTKVPCVYDTGKYNYNFAKKAGSLLLFPQCMFQFDLVKRVIAELWKWLEHNHMGSSWLKSADKQ